MTPEKGRLVEEPPSVTVPSRRTLGGGFSPLQSSALPAVAARVDATPRPIALAWLLQRSPNILLIPGTSSAAHLRENVASAGLSLSGKALAELDTIGH
jgi:aryl-alcohol dehydrogenase-like predicted oxidoreductase